MSDLLGLLGLGATGLSAQHTGVAIAGNNIANVDTEGYSRQRVDLRAELAAPLVGGVRSGSPARVADGLLAGRERAAGGAAGYSGALGSALSDLESRLSAGGTIDGDLTKLWQSFGRVSGLPTDPLTRQAAVTAAGDVATGFRARADGIAAARGDADLRIRDAAAQATALAKQIADANTAIKTSSDPVLLDRRDTAARQLAGLVGGTARVDPDGQMRWILPDGAALVDGGRAASIETTPDPTTGYRKVEIVDGSNRRDVTATLTGGSIGGDLAFRDVDAAQAATDLDQLAYDFATSVNAAHRAAAGLDGVSGRDLFTAPTAVTGAAAALVVDPAIAADPDKLATAAIGAGPGDNTGALALFAIKDQLGAAGGTTTFTDAAIHLHGSVGQRVADATADSARDAAIGTHLADLRDAVSGVDLDEELASMVHFQHASEAMTKFVSTVDDMLSNLLGSL